jgi:SAM-dependent MidA family methyltransferase
MSAAMAEPRSASELIAEEIRDSGPISFARFMELALYSPKLGYYERALAQTGKQGDFYTNVSVGRLFGEMLGFDLARKLSSIDSATLQIVEAGAHDGQLASDILTYLREYFPYLFGKLEYIIIDPSAFRQHIQGKALAAFESSVTRIRRWSDLPISLTGAIISNELLDAIPVHVFRWISAKKKWREFGVALEGKRFVWTPLDHASAEPDALLPEIPASLAEVLPDQFTIEVSPAAIEWWKQAARALRSGFLMTIDYGLRAEQFLAPEHARGTLRSYSKHRYGSSVLESPGEYDITAHVSFSAIIRAGQAEGLQTIYFSSQSGYLKNLVEQIDQQQQSFPLWTPARFRQLKSLIHPEHLGRAFKVLVQQR